MKKKKTFIVFLTILCAVIIAAITHAQFANKAKKDEKNRTSKITYKNYIWIEGEHAVSTNFAREPIYNFFCSNKYALQLSKDADPPQDGYFATYVFYVTHTKEYDLWMGCTPPGSVHNDRPGYASPIEWKIDNGPFQVASAENVYVKNYYGIGGFYWVKIASGTLNAGKHTLTIRVKQKRSSGWDYYFYVDAILLFPKYSTGIAALIDFPDVAPQDFTTPGDGILFNVPDFYEKKLRTNINDRESLFTLVQIYGWLYEYNKAIFLLQKYLERNPRDIDMRFQLAAFYSWSDQLDAAISEYKNIISIDEKNITARKLLSVLAGWNNRYDEAIKYYQEIIAIDPENVDAYISLGTQYSWKGEMNRAIATFEKAEMIAPNNVELLEVLGDNYYWAGRTYDAIRQYSRIINIDEKRIPVYKKLAKVYLDLGENEKAGKIINDAKQVVDLYPELSGISLNVKDELEKERLALIESYKDALLKNPDDIKLRKSLVDTYIWNRMYAEAVKEYDALLAYKVFHSIEQAEQKLTKLAIHTVGLQSVMPLIKTIRNDVRTIHKKYAKLIEDKKKGKTVIEPSSIARDKALLERYIVKLKEIQKELYIYNDITAAFGKDVQTYTAMQAATRWKFEPQRVLGYAETAKKLNPQMYHPYKVQGTIDLLYGNPSKAVSSFESVKKLTANAELPGLPLAYAQVGKYKEAIALLEEALQDKKFSAVHRNDIEQVLALAKLNTEKVPSQNSLQDIEEALVNASSLLGEIVDDIDQKLSFGLATMRYVYEKQFLDMEIDNARIYREIANFYLQNGNYIASRKYNSYILKVQPLNVEANLAMGNINEFLGYWKDAKENYEICINAQPDFEYAKKAHYELQKKHAPSLTGTGIYFSDNIRTRYGIGISGLYEPTQYFILQAGYEFTKQTDSGGIATTGQLFYPSDGNVAMHKAFAEISVPIRLLYLKLFANLAGNMYSGTVDYGNHLFDTSLNYFSLSYAVGFWWMPPATGITVRVAYSRDDENDLSQSLKMKFRDAITYNMIEGWLDINFSEYNFPLSKRLYWYNSVQYRMLSDSNTRLTSFNQLTVRVYRMPQWNMFFDIAGVYTYEDTKFSQYSSGDIVFVPYWAPRGISYYGPMIKVSQQIDTFGGNLLYSIFLEYKYNSLNQRTLMPGISISQNWDKLNLFAEYLYSNVTLPNSTTDKTYISHDLKFGARGKFFRIYSPKGAGAKPVLFVSANPNLITPDGDGRDDFATLSLTAFDEKGIQQWWIEIYNEKGEKIQEYSLTGAVPATFRWDGTAKNNVLAPEGKYYVMLTIQNSAGERFSSKKQEIVLSTQKRAVALTPLYAKFSPNGDKIKDTVSFIIQATDKKNVASWFVSISSKAKIVKTIRGNDFIPYDVQWDGFDDNLKPVPDGEYSATMTITYNDGIVVKSPVTTVTVVTKVAVDIKVEPNEIVPLQNTLRITPTVNGDAVQWQIQFMRLDGAVVKVINGAGMPPKVISWDGSDDTGEPAVYNMQLECQMEITDEAGNTAVSKKIPFMVGFLVKQDKDKRIVYMFNQDTIFKGRSDELTVNGIMILDQLAGKLAKMGDFTRVNIVAYTDAVGSKQSNIALSQKQAAVIANRLKNLPAQIKTVGAGAGLHYLKDKPSKWDMRYEIELY